MIFKNQSIIIIFLAIIFTVIALFLIRREYQTPLTTVPQIQHTTKIAATIPQSPAKNPKSLNLSVPFTVQAPSGNWDAAHEETCEEAAVIMADAFFKQLPDLKAEYVEKQIRLLTEWENKNLGYNKDTTAQETAKMIANVYGLKTKLVQNFTVEDLKTELAQNHLIIIPTAGKLLNNPFYTPPGPLYHMLLIKGYTENEKFITNDPGTKRGLNYTYEFKTLFSAAADWDHNLNNINNNKIAIIIWQ